MCFRFTRRISCVGFRRQVAKKNIQLRPHCYFTLQRLCFVVSDARCTRLSCDKISIRYATSPAICAPHSTQYSVEWKMPFDKGRRSPLNGRKTRRRDVFSRLSVAVVAARGSCWWTRCPIITKIRMTIIIIIIIRYNNNITVGLFSVLLLFLLLSS